MVWTARQATGERRPLLLPRLARSLLQGGTDADPINPVLTDSGKDVRLLNDLVEELPHEFAERVARGEHELGLAPEDPAADAKALQICCDAADLVSEADKEALLAAMAVRGYRDLLETLRRAGEAAGEGGIVLLFVLLNTLRPHSQWIIVFAVFIGRQLFCALIFLNWFLRFDLLFFCLHLIVFHC